MSGKVDAVRLPKEAFLCLARHAERRAGPPHHRPLDLSGEHGEDRLCRGEPLRPVELFLNGKSLGATNSRVISWTRSTAGQDPRPHRLHLRVPQRPFCPRHDQGRGPEGGKIVAQEEIETAGAPKAIRLTAHTGPNGLQADGSDVASSTSKWWTRKGRRCPTDEARVDFKVDGPAIWRGGFNSGMIQFDQQPYLDTECGINRVAIRSTLTPGTITLTAARPGLAPATVKIESRTLPAAGGSIP